MSPEKEEFPHSDSDSNERADRKNWNTRLDQINQATNQYTEGSQERNKLEQERKILEYLIVNLSEAEERILEPMAEKCEISVVIPAYAERDYILFPLESLAKQQGIRTEQFEVIIVINNPESTPQRISGESDRDYERRVDLYNSALKENQEVLALLRFIHGEDIPLDLTEQEKGFIETIRQSKLRIFAIDKASSGKAFSTEEANVGAARNRGVVESVARFYEQSRNGIIAQSDADVLFEENYLANVIKVFEDNPTLVGATGPTTGHYLENEEKEELEKLGVYTDIVTAYEDFEEYLRQQSISGEGHTHTVRMTGANMVSRAYQTALIGGVPKEYKDVGGEDAAFSDKLAQVGKIQYFSELATHPIHRLSARVGMEGGGAGIFKIKLQEMIAERGTVFVGPEGARKPIEEALPNLIDALCTNEEVHDRYERELGSLQREDPLQAAVGIDDAVKSLWLRSQALHRAVFG